MKNPRAGARRFRIADCRFAIDGDCHGLRSGYRETRESGGRATGQAGQRGGIDY
ncbi:MAG: hypothetical protein NTX52_06170 [Planctomycetota bacterium]|nr:hypothetical protein [Planctomycetota bacterium]